MAGKMSARLRREDNAVEVSRELRASLHTHSIEQVELAAACGVDQPLAHRWCSVTEPHAIHVHDLLLAPKEVAEDLLRFVAEKHGLKVTPCDGATLEGGSISGARDVLSAVNSLTNTHLGALADESITDAELDAIEREANHAIESVVRLANWAKSEKRARADEKRLLMRIAPKARQS